MSDAERRGPNRAPAAVEDYLKSIYLLAEAEAPVSTSRIAEARSVSPASVTSMVQRLARQGLLDYRKHRGVTLTPEGQRQALRTIRRHRLLELYLTEALGFRWDEVHEQAERLEHAVSEKLMDRIAAVLGDPAFDPHGDPIPAKDGTIAALDDLPLTALAVGDRARVSRVIDDSNGELLRHLAELGLVPGARFEILDEAPMRGPLTIRVGSRERVVGRTVASLVQVRRQEV